MERTKNEVLFSKAFAVYRQFKSFRDDYGSCLDRYRLVMTFLDPEMQSRARVKCTDILSLLDTIDHILSSIMARSPIPEAPTMGDLAGAIRATLAEMTAELPDNLEPVQYSESEYVQSSTGESSSETSGSGSSESSAGAARAALAAAVVPAKRRGRPPGHPHERAKRGTAAAAAVSATASDAGAGYASEAAAPPMTAAAALDRNLEENDAMLRAASWRDLEDTRRFLENDHRERFDTLVARWEGVEDGDDVDLGTGRVVLSRGHLEALAPQRNMAFFDEDDEIDEDDDDDEEKNNEAGTGQAGRRAGEFEGVLNPLYTVCERPARLLDTVVRELRA